METVEQPNEKRPTYLKVLVILSTISIALSILFTVYSIMAGPLTASELKATQEAGLKAVNEFNEMQMTSLADWYEHNMRMEVYINANWYMQHLLTFLVLLFGLFGVWKMYQGQKQGFHFYIIYNILAAATIYISVPMSEVPSQDLILNLSFSFLFIWMYSRNLAYMNK